jgi:hypothetical protein
MLHAYSLVFDHPVTGARLLIEAPLDEQLARACRDLGFEIPARRTDEPGPDHSSRVTRDDEA